MPDDTEHAAAHAAAHAALSDPSRSALARQWAMNDHLSDPAPAGHGLDRWGDLPSDPAARERLHGSLPHPDPAPLLTVVENAHSQMEHSSPADHPDVAMVTIASLFDRLAADDTPATAVSAVKAALAMLGGALDKLAAADPSSYVPVLHESVSTLAERLQDGDTDPRDD